jgi:fluoroquinolone transport system permease protein
MLYIVVLCLLPAAWERRVAILLIFTDPAALGLYFMGALILFEKSERILDSVAISPVRTTEYVVSKLVSLAIISLLSGAVIGFYGEVVENPFNFLLGVFLGSCLFSAVGLVIAVHVTSLNEFVVTTIPAGLIINLPAIAWLFGYQPRVLALHPGVCIIKMLQNAEGTLSSTAILCVWSVLTIAYAVHFVSKKFRSLGGVVL